MMLETSQMLRMGFLIEYNTVGNTNRTRRVHEVQHSLLMTSMTQPKAKLLQKETKATGSCISANLGPACPWFPRVLTAMFAYSPHPSLYIAHLQLT